MLKVMIVEDDMVLLSEFEQALEYYPDIKLIGTTDRETDAWNRLLVDEPDALILDLELTEGSGLMLLKKMSELGGKKPFITVMTNVVSQVIYDTVRSLGVDYICSKKAENFSPETVLMIIDITSPFQIEGASKFITVTKYGAKSGNRKKVMQDKVSNSLEIFGFSYKHVGTGYINEALLLVLGNPEMEINITKNLYPQIAKKHHCNVEVVEKNIRVAIEDAWRRKTPEEMKKLYPHDWSIKTGRPTNLEFIRNVSRYLTR